MPNKGAKERKRKRILTNKMLAKQGRTARQYKKWLEKNESKDKTGYSSYKR